MPRININEIDNTLYSTNELTNDNIVYVPGNTITGEYERPVLLATVDDFESKFGGYGVPGSPTYNYVRGLLIAGLPVLFRRIVGSNMDSDDESEREIKIEKAFKELTVPITSVKEVSVEGLTIENLTIDNDHTVNVDLKNESGDTISKMVIVVIKHDGLEVSREDVNIDSLADGATKAYSKELVDITFDQSKTTVEVLEGIEETEPVAQLRVEEKWGGSYGNNLKVAIVKVSSSYYFRVYYKTKVIEDVFIATEPDAKERIKLGLDTEEKLSAYMKNKYKEFFGEVVEDENGKLHKVENTGYTFNSINVEMLVKPEDFILPAIEFNRTETEEERQEKIFALENGVDVTDDVVKEEIPNTYDFIKDKYIYDVKFITAGGYTDKTQGDSENPSSISYKQDWLCRHRGDCFALLDIPRGTLKSEVTNWFTAIDSSYSAAYAPWCYTKLPNGEYEWMAPSYLFLYTLGRSIQDGNQVYDAPAGVLKASMPQVVKPEYEIGGDLLEYWTSGNPQCINPLMKLQTYGYVIYGQNTLYNIQNKASSKESALQKINVRLAINEVRRILFKAAIRLTFQANNIRTWNAFKALVEPQLSTMKSNGGISDFRIVMNNTTTTQEDIQNNTIRARVSISVMKAVENFELDFYIEPQAITFAEEENSKNVLIGGLFQD